MFTVQKNDVLVYLSEQSKDCRIVTIDRADFTAYRRHGRELIPLLLPDSVV